MILANLNSLSRSEFVSAIGSVFEHSPWIAEAAWVQRPFASIGHLHQSLCAIVRTAGEARQLALIRAHPDLVGRLARAGKLTRESRQEQASAGLERLTAEEIQRFEEHNAAYQARFGFPFIICARLNRKESILRGFQLRLQNSRAHEIETALAEIGKIAYLRLCDIIQNPPPS